MTTLRPTSSQTSSGSTTKTRIPNVKSKVTKCVSGIVLDDPFYGYVLLRLKIVETTDIPTACVDGVNLFYNPYFIDTLNARQTKGLFKHEVMHLALLHHVRRGNRDGERWNMAADYVINALLLKSGEELPPDGLVDEKYADFSTEHVYNLLEQEEEEGGQDGEPCEDGEEGRSGRGKRPLWGEVADHPDMANATEDAIKQIEEDVRVEIINAYNAAKLQGKLPAGMDRVIGSIRESKLPWKRILAKYFRSRKPAGEDWMVPNRRFLQAGIYLPGRRQQKMGSVVTVLDTSGSVTESEIDEFVASLNSILKGVQPETVDVIYADSAVAGHQVFKPGQALTVDKLQIKGGGGTDFRPAFEFIDENIKNPHVVVYLTDMWGPFPDSPPKYPVIWVSTSKDKKAPFGKTLEVEI